MVDKKKIYEFHDLVLDQLNSENLDLNFLKQRFLDAIDSPKVDEFINGLVQIQLDLRTDLDYFMLGDPAVTSKEEVVLTYPGYYAIASYRIAHSILKLGLPLEARIISERAHTLTGIDIHPGAQISSPIFIDHGTGIVIGETTIIGKRVRIYQGVTLGALSLTKGYLLKGTKRHPTVKDDVIIYSGASILGNITINEDVTIGSNVFLLEDVPAHTKVTISKPELVVNSK